jgi:hypothetical protein
LSLVRKHSVTIRGHRTSFSIEDPFFEILEEMAVARDLPLASPRSTPRGRANRTSPRPCASASSNG